MDQSLSGLLSSKSVEWYTPPQYVEAARRVMGGIDLDPASSAAANQTVQATRFYSEVDNGLDQPWTGRVFINPPGGKIKNKSYQGFFAHKLLAEFNTGNVVEGIVLLNLYTGYEWFKPLRTLPMCFLDHRIGFINSLTGQVAGPAK